MKHVNKAKDVFKIVHENREETCVKTVDSISTEKSTVFISSSVGCPLKCKFCHLTMKGHKYKPLSRKQITENTINTVNWAGTVNPRITEKNLKLSWMGMGDAFFNLNNTLRCSEDIMKRVDVAGLDKVDISTALPKSVTKCDVALVNKIKARYGSKVRWFYSLFSAVEGTRDYMIPNTHTPTAAVELFEEMDVSVIAHQTFLDGVNDSEEEVKAIVDFVNTHKDVITQLRVLRYNTCEAAWWYESERYSEIVKYLQENLEVELKLQDSPGKEIKAACGMFD